MIRPASIGLEATVFDTASRTHVGKVREINEDRVLMQSEAGLWAIADGMGGHSLGDQAAAEIMRALGSMNCATPGQQAIGAALQLANDATLELAQKAGVTCGSTVAGICISNDDCMVFWVGDSRVYRLRGDSLVRLTRDHSFVQQLTDAGVMTERQARADPRSSIITRALGIAPIVEVDIVWTDVLTGDLFLICSDGLSDMIDDAGILAMIACGDPEDMTDRLIRAALAAGGTDNISVAVIICNG
jgi:serine/threonine protein phosphatase PrpC